MGRYGPRAGRLRGGGVSRRRPRGARHRREPAHCDALPDPGQPRLGRGPRLHAVLHDELHLRRALPSRSPIMPGLFNIGGEGQATLGGPRRRARRATTSTFLPGFLLMPLGILGAAAFGAAWAAVPGYLQAKRGSHIVITTIMFNWLASVLIVYLLVNVLREPQLHEPGNARLPGSGAQIPFMHEVLRRLRHRDPALAAQPHASCWRSRQPIASGSSSTARASAMRSASSASNPSAAVYAGISPARITIIAMVLSGALAGGLAVNELMGYQHRLLLEFTSGYGFVGIAVALMGRAHPVGIILASLLFGILYQGGAELAFEQPAITRDMVVVIGGIIILFAGALDGLFRRARGASASRARSWRGRDAMDLGTLVTDPRLGPAALDPAARRLPCRPLVRALRRRRYRARGQDAGRRLRGRRGGLRLRLGLDRPCSPASPASVALRARSRLRLDQPARQPDRLGRRHQHAGGGPDRDRRQCLVRAGRAHAAARGRAALRRRALRPLGPGLPRAAGRAGHLVRARPTPASACACAPSARTRPRSTPPAFPSPACATPRSSSPACCAGWPAPISRSASRRASCPT